MDLVKYEYFDSLLWKHLKTSINIMRTPQHHGAMVKNSAQKFDERQQLMFKYIKRDKEIENYYYFQSSSFAFGFRCSIECKWWVVGGHPQLTVLLIWHPHHSSYFLFIHRFFHRQNIILHSSYRKDDEEPNSQWI